MNIELQGQAIAPPVNIEAVKAMVGLSVAQIASKAALAIMAVLQDKQTTFKELAEKTISATHKEEYSASDAKVQRVYIKLVRETLEFLKANSQPMLALLGIMNTQTGNEDSAGMFLGTFALPFAKDLVEKLQVEQPGALEMQEIWKANEQI